MDRFMIHILVDMDALQNDMRRGVELESARMVYQFCENRVERQRWGVPHNPDLIVDFYSTDTTLCVLVRGAY